MQTIKIIIERSKDHYNAYAQNVKGTYGAGDTVAEATQSILDSIKLLKKYNEEKNIQQVLKGEYQLSFNFDTESLLYSTPNKFV